MRKFLSVILVVALTLCFTSAVFAFVATNDDSTPLGLIDDDVDEDGIIDDLIDDFVKDRIRDKVGCNAGLGIFALVFIPFVVRRRK